MFKSRHPDHFARVAQRWSWRFIGARVQVRVHATGTNMKIVVKYFPEQHPPLLSLSIHDAPHRREHIATLRRYRQALYDACKSIGMSLPLEHPIDMHVMFVEPSSPDLGGSYIALEQCMDGKTMSKENAVLADDSLLSKVTMSTYFPHTGTKK